MDNPRPHADLDNVKVNNPLVAMPPRTFYGAPGCNNIDEFNGDIAILGVPYDQGSLIPHVRTGQSQGPKAVRENPTFFYGGNPFDGPPDPSKPSDGFYCVDDGKTYLAGVRMQDIGDVVITPGDLPRFVATTSEVARRIAEKKAILASIGGDHSIAFPLIKGMEPWGKVDMVHFDSHYDIRDNIIGSRYSHCSPICRAAELDFVGNITQFGMRNMGAIPSIEQVKKLGTKVVTASEMLSRGPARSVEENLPQAENIYVTIDVDVFDWSIVPGAALPEPGGLSLNQMRECLQVLCRKGRVVGFDVACLDPPYDDNFYGGITSRLVSYLTAFFLGYIIEEQRRKS